MRMSNVGRAGVAALATVLLLPGPAAADPAAGAVVGDGSLGAVEVVLDGMPVTVAPLAPCAAGDTPTASSPGAAVPGFVEFAGGTSSCTVTGSTVTVSVTGGGFRLDGLTRHGGPRIEIDEYTVSCAASPAGGDAQLKLSGVSGVSVPSPIPPNHVVRVPGPAGSPPVATVTMNETVLPPDGGLSVVAMRVRLAPAGPGADSGDVVVGAVDCAG